MKRNIDGEDSKATTCQGKEEEEERTGRLNIHNKRTRGQIIGCVTQQRSVVCINVSKDITKNKMRYQELMVLYDRRQ